MRAFTFCEHPVSCAERVRSHFPSPNTATCLIAGDSWRMAKVLLTSFGPFGLHEENPSVAAVAAVAESGVEGAQLVLKSSLFWPRP